MNSDGMTGTENCQRPCFKGNTSERDSHSQICRKNTLITAAVEFRGSPGSRGISAEPEVCQGMHGQKDQGHRAGITNDDPVNRIQVATTPDDNGGCN